MELPKNITQIGEADRTCKVYVEDYVVSYMKQLCRQAEGKGLTIALYGRYAREQSLSYFFIYGACQILSISKEVRHLSQAQNQEVERLRQRYFPEYVFLGYHIFDGEMVEGMHIQEQDTCRYIKGYACFYEKNDSMLAYMVENKPQEHEPEQFGQEKYDRARAKQEERRSQYGQKKTPAAHTKIAADKPEKQTGKNVQNVAQTSSLKMMRMSAAAVFAVLCLIGVAAVTRDGEDGTIEERAKQLWAQLTDDQPETDASAPKDAAGEIHNSGTLMAENSLADAILQENRDATAVSGQAVTGQPQQNEENGQGETGAGQNTGETGAGQNTGESGIGQNTGESGPGQAQNTGQESGQTQNAGQGSGPEQENGQGNRPEQGTISGQESGQSQGDKTGSEQGSGQGQEESQGQEAGQNQGGQSVESLNPGAGPGENAADAQPQEIPTQGPSIAETEAQQQAQQASYVIQPGDTLIGISTRQYGNDSYVRAICELNGISNPDNIQVGQKILLP